MNRTITHKSTGRAKSKLTNVRAYCSACVDPISIIFLDMSWISYSFEEYIKLNLKWVHFFRMNVHFRIFWCLDDICCISAYCIMFGLWWYEIPEKMGLLSSQIAEIWGIMCLFITWDQLIGYPNQVIGRPHFLNEISIFMLKKLVQCFCNWKMEWSWKFQVSSSFLSQVTLMRSNPSVNEGVFPRCRAN